MVTYISKIILFFFGYLLIVISLIPLIRNDNWVFRVFEYPRSQKLVINIFILSLFLPVSQWSIHDNIFVAALFCNLVYMIYQVWPYTFLAQRQMKRSANTNQDRRFSLMICNVFQDNREFDKCLDAIKLNDPDIVLLVEVNEHWKLELDRKLVEKYGYRISKPLNNTYGMLLYSRLRLIDSQVKFLVEDDVPSIHTKVLLPSGETFQLYGLHPKPPVPHETSRSTERDAEILLVAKESEKCKLPVIVAGDLNDVAWSYTTELFLKVSRLLDPRRGRGFYNTFHAHYWFLRWPLDHIFCSEHFELVMLKRLPSVGSDHFPIFVTLDLCSERAHENKNEALEAGSSDVEVADEKIEKAMVGK